MLVFPNYEGTQIAGTGHFLMMEKPDECNLVLTTFFDKIGFRSLAGLS
jgi:pimeloyl-ACP methyl ester carboxylesterase